MGKIDSLVSAEPSNLTMAIAVIFLHKSDKLLLAHILERNPILLLRHLMF